jgi:putative membrane protein
MGSGDHRKTRSPGSREVRATADAGCTGKVMRIAWIGIFLAVLIWSGIGPKDFITWCLEVAPAVLGGVVLWFTRERFPLTTLVYVLILTHCIVLMVGGHYTYAEVPLGEWMRELVDGSRNNYDKLGHFVQGFVPVMIARELMIRLEVFNSASWRDFFIVCFCLAFSAFYELIEWWVALLSDEAADAFLGTQGYVWDTQSDMGWALFGAVLALVLLGRPHDRQLRERGFVPAV